MNVLGRLRVEDAIACGFAMAIVTIFGLRATVVGLHLDETHYWELAFILAPLAVLVFNASVRYAFAGGGPFGAILENLGGMSRDWLPFLFVLSFYEIFSTRLWGMLQHVDRDAMLLSWDRLLFGETPSVWFESILHPALTEIMRIAYFMHLVLPPVVAYLWYRRNRTTFREFLLSILIAAILGSIGYMLVPAVGPLLAFPELYDRDLGGGIAEPLLALMDKARAPRDVFPSLHVGVATIVLWFGWKRGRLLGFLLLPIVTANWVSTVYLRYHYVVDVFAGWVVAILSILLSVVFLAAERRILAPLADRAKDPS